MATIDLSVVEILNSPDVRTWPATATITRLEFRPGGVHIEHTKRSGPHKWPNFRPTDWDGDLQYTLWMIQQIGGRWYGSGGIQFWEDCDQNGGAPEYFSQGWFYAADRWGIMTGHQPQPGEIVGFMVTAGDARNNGKQTVQERSNVVVIPFPSVGGSYQAPDAAPPDSVPLPPPDPDLPVPDEDWKLMVLRRLTALEELGNPETVVHVGAKVAVSGNVRFIGPVSGTGTVSETGPK